MFKLFAFVLILMNSLNVYANDYFKALELFNKKKYRNQLSILKRSLMISIMKKEVMQCLILL